MAQRIQVQVKGIDQEWYTLHDEILIKPTYTIGRASTCDICLVEILNAEMTRTISSIHFSMYRRSVSTKSGSGALADYIEPGYDGRDGLPGKPSSNGCLYNGSKMVQKVHLSHGDVIGIASNIRLVYINENKSVTQIVEDTLIDAKTDKVQLD
jgi:pSer/pThr/pTyr-binding forkhead associated (FHA) protein